MSRTLVVFTHKTDGGRGAIASEITQDDIDRGRGGVLGDYYVVEPGQRPQWHERRTFEADWEPLASPKDAADLGPVIDDARAQIDALEPLGKPAPAGGPLLDDDDTPAGVRARLDQLEQHFVAARQRGIEAAGEIMARIDALEAHVADVDKGVVVLGKTADEEFTKVLERVTVLEANHVDVEELGGTFTKRIAALEEAAALSTRDLTKSDMLARIDALERHGKKGGK